MHTSALSVHDALTLLSIQGVGRKRIYKLLADASPGASSARDLLAGKYSAAVIEAAASEAARVEEHALKSGHVLLGPAELPPLLRATKDPPVVLFVRGSIEVLSAPAAAVVGTRTPSDFGARAATKLGRLLAEAGVVVVSGLALGCDAAAHRACLEAQGTTEAAHGATVAVLAHGLGSVYPSEHRTLAEQIVEAGGTLITEYRLGVRPQRHHFVERDRIQAGLSSATIVVETSVDGGTMHTARFCRADGRRLLCVVHPTESRGNAGNRRLLDSEGAEPLDSPEKLKALLSTLRPPP